MHYMDDLIRQRGDTIKQISFLSNKSFEKQTSMASTINLGEERGAAIIYHSFRQLSLIHISEPTRPY